MKTRLEKKFTLIELLVVIGIIALLAALLFPAIGSVRAHAKKVKAQAAITALKTAITQYEAQYGLLPFSYNQTTNAFTLINDPDGGKDIQYIPGTNDDKYDDLINLLSCVDVDDDGDNSSGDSMPNLRKTRFLTGLPASGTKDAERTLTDPYKISGEKHGTRFAFVIDISGNNKVEFNSTTYNGKIFIWSFGADGNNDWGAKTGTDNDDVPSWE